MTESELVMDPPSTTLLRLAEEASGRKRRLFACACCRAVWYLLVEEASRRAVETSERYADAAAEDERREAEAAAFRVAEASYEALGRAGVWVGRVRIKALAAEAAARACLRVVRGPEVAVLTREAAERAAGNGFFMEERQRFLLLDHFGHLVSRAEIAPTCRTPEVVSLAR